MAVHGLNLDSVAEDQVLRWQGRLLTAEDLRGRLNGHRELIVSERAIVTPLAEEHLRANGVRITRQAPKAETTETTATKTWGYAQEQPVPAVIGAVQAVQKQGIPLKELPMAKGESAERWAKAVAECVVRGECLGGIVFCQDPGLVCCVANKLAGLRAAPVLTVSHAARATRGLGANLLAVEMPGRTFFEIRQILQAVCKLAETACPDSVACTLKGLESHAHR